MTKHEIISELSRKRKVEYFIMNTAKMFTSELQDLAQDIYLILLEQDDDKIIGMYERNELDYFIARIITNQLISTSSPFYTKYKKFRNLSDDIKDNITNNTDIWKKPAGKMPSEIY